MHSYSLLSQFSIPVFRLNECPFKERVLLLNSVSMFDVGVLSCQFIVETRVPTFLLSAFCLTCFLLGGDGDFFC